MMLRFYFDYVSPYAYLAWPRVREMCASRALELAPTPVLFAGLLERFGQLGPAEVEPKRESMFRHVLRVARRRAVPFVGPPAHPFNPLVALRVSLPEVAADRVGDVVDAVFAAAWGRGRDVSDPEELARVLGEAGLDGPGLVARAGEPGVKAALRLSTEQAAAAGVFGVPTVGLGAELFWGNDQLEDVRGVLDGDDTLDRALLAEVLARPRGADRRR